MSNEKIERQLEMANLSYKGENFEDAYQKYSAILEEDFENKKAWIGKGLSAGRMSNTDKNILSEAEICLNKAKEQGLDESEKQYILDEIFELTEKFIDKIHQSVAHRLTDLDQRPMATYEKPSVRLIGNLADRFDAFSEHWEYYKKAIEFSRYSLTIDNSLEIKKRVLAIIDGIINESKLHFDKKYKPVLVEFREQIIKEIRKDEPDFQPKQLESDKGGCFIATATYGTFNAPVVMELRVFRDDVLKRSRAGRSFINFYYCYSPALAKAIRSNTHLKLLSKWLLERCVIPITRGLRNI